LIRLFYDNGVTPNMIKREMCALFVNSPLLQSVSLTKLDYRFPVVRSRIS